MATTKKKITPIKPAAQAVVEIRFTQGPLNPKNGSIAVMTGSSPAYSTLQEWFNNGWRITMITPTSITTPETGANGRYAIAVLSQSLQTP